MMDINKDDILNLMTQKGFTSILILVGILIIAVIGGIYYLGLQRVTTVIPYPTPIVTSQTSSSPSSTLDKTANWKIYTNPSFGFSFMYPPEVSVEENKDSKNNSRVYIHPSFYNINEAGLLQGQNLYNKIFQIYITVQNNPQDLTASQFAANDISGLTKSNPSDSTLQTMQKAAQKSIKPYTIGQIEGIYTVFGEAHSIPNVYISQNHKLYVITFVGPQGDPASPDTQKLIDQILSTFKFTN